MSQGEPCYFLHDIRFSRADGFDEIIGLIASQVSREGQLAHVLRLLLTAHLRISQSFSQKNVFCPSVRHPSQLICSGRMGALLSSAQSFAVFSLRA